MANELYIKECVYPDGTPVESLPVGPFVEILAQKAAEIIRAGGVEAWKAKQAAAERRPAR